jgi:energy-coupling factor transporter ATP-binding protein EcfA2
MLQAIIQNTRPQQPPQNYLGSFGHGGAGRAKRSKRKTAQDFVTIKAGDQNDDDIEQVPAVGLGVAPKHPFRMVITGPSGSGKTTVACHLLENVYEDYFDEIYLVSPTAKHDPAWKRCKDMDGFEIKDELDTEFLGDLYEESQTKVDSAKSIKNAKKILVAFDDFISNSRYMRSDELLTLAVQGRHAGISLMFLSQSYMKINRSVRLQATDLLFFPANLSEVTRVSDEHCPPNTSKKDFMKLVLFATNEKYNFLYIAKREKPEKRFRKNLDTYLSLPGWGDNQDQDKDQDQDQDQDEDLLM